MQPENSDPKQTTKYRPGQSGNPAGKPKGARNAVTLAVERLLENEAEAITRKAIDAALAGDMIAIKLTLDRIAPVRRGRPVAIALPSVDTAAGVGEAVSAVVQAVAAGELTPEEGVTLTGILEARRKAIETLEIEARLAALEGRQS